MNKANTFRWGVATSAFQIEGAYNKDGKGLSIWDNFTKKTTRIKDRSNAHTTIDFYNRYKEDINIAKNIGFEIFRFSVSWSRILPDGSGKINQKGIDFYNNVINYCLETGIEPWITTYHWDLPLELEKKGGWANREIVDWYRNYVIILRNNFADRVKNWILINEGIVFTGGGYLLGLHAPGKRSINKFVAGIHHVLLSQAEGLRVLKQFPGQNVGTAISCTKIDAYNNKKSNIKTAKRIDALMNRIFIEPHLGMGYPMDTLPLLKRINKYYRAGDEEKIIADFDFWGIQTYAREVVKRAWYIPYLGAVLVNPKKRKAIPSVMGWETYTEGVAYFIERFSKYNPKKTLWVTECGIALDDNENEKLRIDYYTTIINNLYKLKMKGINVKGILIWTLVDNFEWAEGYIPKFGIIGFEKETLKRIFKKSSLWFKDILSP
ncbi:glycoside hydrolase family 1 protein [Abyssalbus ytuae]|uniref:Family 1 glycosylhydrolase n=1 Tax=Abyssalbus ytuae TaxID=2926907 RepID=A0A9E7D0W7_9FLAO|nr:family 1 glycosylhydrolase [Abyssalbus ytuae]UOB16448.1 family 1 glycosylhydrolase [Abyssalbus ytuae]